MILGLIKNSQDLFNDTLGHWDIKPVKIQKTPGSNLASLWYYLVACISKETFKIVSLLSKSWRNYTSKVF